MNKNSFSPKSQTDWARLDAMADDDIDFSDIPELTEEQLKSMKPAREFFAERGISFDPTPPHTVTVYHEDGRSTTHLLAPAGQTIVLDADVQSFFPDSKSVNNILRSLIALIPQR
ncbi:MAG: hypothetical protein GY805_01440 [Chloroflexi bacterium]|nr:hypothetical protein [Chloroflexota bacterium]